MTEDPLRPAKGCINGVLLSLGVVLIVIIVLELTGVL